MLRARRRGGKRSVAAVTAAMVVGALLIPLSGSAMADPTGIILTPETDTAPVNACNEFTATVTQDDPTLAGEVVSITITQSDADTAQDNSIAFCDPDGVGPATNAGGSRDLDDNPTFNDLMSAAPIPAAGIEFRAEATGACTTDATAGECSFGVTSNEAGSMTVVASATDPTPAPGTTFSDTSTKTWVTAAVASVDCSPETDSNPEVTSHSFTCRALTAAGAGVPGQTLWFDVTAGPNAEEIVPQACPTVTDGTGTTTCSYTDVGGAGSPPGTDTIVGYFNLTCPRAGVAVCGNGPEPDEPQDEITKAFVGAPRVIDCEPEEASNTSGTTHVVTCTVTDRVGNGTPDVVVTFDETGPGRFATGGQTVTDTTDSNGEATADLASTAEEEGDQTVTGRLAIEPGVQECERAANDPAGAPAGVCTDDVVKTWVAPQVIRVPSSVGINHRLRPRHVFRGRVAADLPRCVRGRTVRIKKVGGPTVGSDRTNRAGRYVERHRRGGRGRYFAAVARKSFVNAAGDNVICQRARSRRIRVRR